MYFRVYGPDRKDFVDYDMSHCDLEVQVVDNYSSLYPDGDNSRIDYPSRIFKKDNQRPSVARYEKFVGEVFRGMKHLGVYRPEDVLLHRTEFPSQRQYEGLTLDGTGKKKYAVHMDSQRYFVFAKSLRCVECGLRGQAMILNTNANGQHPDQAHFNLYGLDGDRLVMLTKDHLRPKSKGGSDRLDNYVTMCDHCNGKKGNRFHGLVKDLMREWDFDL